MRSERIVVQVRAVALLLAVLGAYLAQHLVLNTAPADLIPPRLVNLFPILRQYIRWRIPGLLSTSLWIYFVSAIVFGLVTPIWRSERRSSAARSVGLAVLARGSESWIYPLAAAGLLSVGASLLRLATATAWLGVFFWLAACALFLYAGVLLQQMPTNGETEFHARLDRSPLDGWPYLLGVLVIATVAYLFRWLQTPIRIDTLTVEAGIIAQGHMDGVRDLHVTALPNMALTATTVWTRLSGDALVGTRMAGLYAGLVLTVAVWLLAAELFRRSPNRGASEAFTDSDAQVNRLIATAVAAFGMPTLFFARAPIVLEGVAWGSLGVWALFYGLRIGLLPVVGASALLLGVSSLYGPTGLTLAVVALAAWAGVFVVRPEWPGLHIRTPHRLRQPDFLYWLAGLAIVLWPLLFGFLTPRYDLGPYLSFHAWLDGATSSVLTTAFAGQTSALGKAAADIQSSIVAPSVAGGTSGLFGVNGMMLSAVLAPLYILGLGAIVFNIDTLTGWTLASWILLGSALSVLFSHPLSPHWSALLVNWPAVALTTAFAFDRLRAGVSEFAGAWTRQASLYLVCGLVAAAAMLGWLSYYEEAMQHADGASAAGREVRRTVQAGESPLVAVSQPWSDTELRVLAFLADVSVDGARALLVPADQLPAALPSNTRLIVAAKDEPALEEVRVRYPGAYVGVYRNHNGNPVAYTFSRHPVDKD